MTWGPVLGVVTAATTGHLVLAGLTPAPVTWAQRAVRAGMALLIGVALHSLWQFVWVARLADRGLGASFPAYDLALPIFALAVLTALRRRSQGANKDARPSGRTGIPVQARHQGKLLLPTAMLACGIGVVFAANLAAAQPDGAWDAWAIWNFKARWLARGGSSWSDILTNHIFATAHPDYPLLLPLSVSRLWTMTGGVPLAVPQAFGVCAAAVVAALLVGATRVLRGPMSAAVAGAGLLVLPPFLAASASQLADVPLACCYLATLVALALGAQGGQGRWFALAGLSAGAAMWTKNEGTLFFVCALAGLVATAARSGGERREAARRIGEFVAGAAPFIVATVVLRWIALPNDLMAGQSVVATWERLTTAGRHVEILRQGVTLLRTLPDAIGVVGVAGYLGFRGLAPDLRPTMPVVITLALTACGYYALYLVTPSDLSWHLTTSADRLLIQLWPSLVFAALFLTRDSPPQSAGA